MAQVQLSTDEVKKLQEAIDNYLLTLHRQIARTDNRSARDHLTELEEALHSIEEKLKMAV